jgi:dTDP-4-dehydrorhamnose 3,5-epimerase
MAKDNYISFNYNELSVDELKLINFKVGTINVNPKIKGVYYKKLKNYVDSRGELVELWSQPWSNKEPIAKEIEHVYFNITHQGITKGWHVHEKTFSQYTCVLGKMQVVLVDVRKTSPTFGYVDQFLIGANNPSLIVIPPGVLKAWKSLQGDSIIVNLLTSPEIKDNFRYPWNAILEDVWEPKNG